MAALKDAIIIVTRPEKGQPSKKSTNICTKTPLTRADHKRESATVQREGAG
jgi:hypothetical protein